MKGVFDRLLVSHRGEGDGIPSLEGVLHDSFHSRFVF